MANPADFNYLVNCRARSTAPVHDPDDADYEETLNKISGLSLVSKFAPDQSSQVQARPAVVRPQAINHPSHQRPLIQDKPRQSIASPSILPGIPPALAQKSVESPTLAQKSVESPSVSPIPLLEDPDFSNSTPTFSTSSSPFSFSFSTSSSPYFSDTSSSSSTPTSSTSSSPFSFSFSALPSPTPFSDAHNTSESPFAARLTPSPTMDEEKEKATGLFKPAAFAQVASNDGRLHMRIVTKPIPKRKDSGPTSLPSAPLFRAPNRERSHTRSTLSSHATVQSSAQAPQQPDVNKKFKSSKDSTFTSSPTKDKEDSWSV